MFALLRFESFFSVWYWALTALVWTLACSRTLGVPYDMILRAERRPETAARVEFLARLGAERIAGLADRAGGPIAALAGFVLAALAVTGFLGRSEAATAAFALLCPLALVAIGALRLARRVRAGNLEGPALRRALARRRAANQGIAALAISVALVLALGYRRARFGL